ncbi:hypothetical protein [Shewanella putrefaciens]
MDALQGQQMGLEAARCKQHQVSVFAAAITNKKGLTLRLSPSGKIGGGGGT